MELSAAFFDKLSRLRLSMGQRTSMNLTGSRNSMQKGTYMEFRVSVVHGRQRHPPH